jgi:hypothetical protein
VTNVVGQPKRQGDAPRQRRLRGDRGAGLTEYALGFSLIAVVAILAGQALTNASQEEAANQADCISDRPPPPSCVRQPVAASTTTGVTTAPTSSTAVPPPTDPPPTTAPPPKGSFTPGTPVATRNTTVTPNTWTVDWPFSIVDDGGQPLANAIVRSVVTVGPQSFSLSCTTDAAGACSLNFADIPVDVASVDIQVVAIVTSPAVDPPYPTVTVPVPPA